MSSIHDPRYSSLLKLLRNEREAAGLSQQEVATRLGVPQSYVAKVEIGERRLDIIELIDFLGAIERPTDEFLDRLGWIVKEPKREVIAVPAPRKAEAHDEGTIVPLVWRDKVYPLVLNGVTPEAYLRVEAAVTALFQALNSGNGKNREAIALALSTAVASMPTANPSDIYHHIVYRIYAREYTKSDVGQSWVRAGGEAVELFIEGLYSKRLAAKGIEIRALLNRSQKRAALAEMGLKGEVGDSKLDLVLTGTGPAGNKVVFGGIHAKASLAERVSDDVPCSEAMMAKGLWSCLFTFDAKSFPPPNGDLVNWGELGSEAAPSDKRKYISDHGSFSCCACYNTRIEPSPEKTKSGRRIYVSTFAADKDPLPQLIESAWEDFRQGRKP